MLFVALGSHNHFCFRGEKSYPEEPCSLEGTLRAVQDAHFEKYKDFVPEFLFQEQSENEEPRDTQADWPAARGPDLTGFLLGVLFRLLTAAALRQPVGGRLAMPSAPRVVGARSWGEPPRVSRLRWAVIGEPTVGTLVVLPTQLGSSLVEGHAQLLHQKLEP